MTAAEHLTTPASLRLTSPSPEVLTSPSPEVVTLPFHQVRRSPLNPRKRFDHAALVGMAVNIYQRTTRDEAGNITGTGIIQNLMARPDPQQPGSVEIAAGERRYRAVELLVQGLTAQVQDGTDANGRPVMVEAFYQVPSDYPLPVRVEEMTDADLIEAATVENVERQEFTPMEEADAYLALKGAGRSEEYIALKYGKHPNTIKSRMQLAAGLGKEGRKLLDADQITLEQAKIIASSTGALKKSLTEQALYGASLGTLKNLVKHAAFLVGDALFDVEASGLRIEEGLLGDFPSKFADTKKALAAQVEALEAVKAQEEGDRWPGGVVVLPVESEHANLPSRDWVHANQRPELVPAMLVLTYSTVNGRSQRFERVARYSDVLAYRQKQREEAERAEREAAAQSGTATPANAPSFKAESGPKVREAAHVLGHQARCMALDGHLAAHPQMCLALACAALVSNASHDRSLMGLSVKGRKPVPLTEEGRALAAQVAQRFHLLFQLSEQGELTYNRLLRENALDAFTAEDVTEADLMAVFAYLTHRQTGAWDANFERPSREVIAFAGKIGADQDVQKRFTLTADFLNAYTTADLHALIDTMPEACKPVGRHGCSKKELVGLIVEKAVSLKEAGWLPELVKFQK